MTFTQKLEMFKTRCEADAQHLIGQVRRVDLGHGFFFRGKCIAAEAIVTEGPGCAVVSYKITLRSTGGFEQTVVIRGGGPRDSKLTL